MNDRVRELCADEAHRGVLSDADALAGERIVRAEGRNPLCGDAVTFYLRIGAGQDGATSCKRRNAENDAVDDRTMGDFRSEAGAPVVAQVAWDGYACLLCRASAEATARLMEGRPAARSCEPPLPRVLHELGDVQPKRSRERCVRLPVDTCKEAIDEYFRSQDR